MEGKLRSWPRRSRGRTGSTLELDRLGGCRPPLATTPQYCPRSQLSSRSPLCAGTPGLASPRRDPARGRGPHPPISTWAAQPGSAQVPAPRPVSSLFRPQFRHLQTGPTRTSQGRAVSQYLLLTHCVFSKQSLVLLEHLIFNRFVFPKERGQ